MINWDKVNELRDEIGAEDFSEVVELFLEEVEETLTKVGEAGRSMEHDMHFLKGSALNLGFHDFSELCRAGEEAAANNPMAEVDAAKIKDCYQASRALFISELSSRLAS